MKYNRTYFYIFQSYRTTTVVVDVEQESQECDYAYFLLLWAHFYSFEYNNKRPENGWLFRKTNEWGDKKRKQKKNLFDMVSNSFWVGFCFAFLIIWQFLQERNHGEWGTLTAIN